MFYFILYKSRIRETLILLTSADRSTDKKKSRTLETLTLRQCGQQHQFYETLFLRYFLHFFIFIYCCAVKSCAVQFSALQLRVLQCSAVQCNVVQCIALQFCAVQCNAVQRSAVQFSGVQYMTKPCSFLMSGQCSLVHKIQCKSVQQGAVYD